MIVRRYNPVERGLPAIWIDGPITSCPSQATRLARRLREFPGDGPVDIVIDGDGGNVVQAERMMAVLDADPRRKRVTILRAMSTHGLVAMAGDWIRIVAGGVLGLHHARLGREAVLNYVGDGALPAVTLRALAATCEEADAEQCAVFSRRTGLPPDEIARLRLNETTLDADEAVRLRFADEVIRD